MNPEEQAKEYVNTVHLDPATYKGDVETAFVSGYMESQNNMIRKLKRDDTLSFSKIAELLEIPVSRVRSAFIDKDQ